MTVGAVLGGLRGSGLSGLALTFDVGFGPRCVPVARVAVRVNLAAVVGFPLRRIADDLIGDREITEALAHVGRAFGCIRVESLRQRAKRGLDVVLARRPLNAEH